MTDDLAFSVSPSSISTFRLCARKWAWSAIDRIPREQAASAALGERIHAIVEAWLRDGKAPDLTTSEGAIAARAMKYLPKPTTCEVEAEFSFEHEGLLLFQGRIDAVTEDCVYDLKTTGDMRWAKTSEQLLTDEQAIIYSQAHMRATLSTIPPALRWVYTKTKGAPSARKVDATLSEREVADGMARIVDTGLAMRRAKRDVKTALELEPTPSACRAFGGCPHIERCNLTNQQKMKGYMKMASLKDKLKSINAPQQPKEETKAEPAPEGAPTTDENPFRKRVAARAAQATPAKEPEMSDKKLAENVASALEDMGAKGMVAPPNGSQPSTETMKSIRVLYIDCIPLTGPASFIDTLFAPQAGAVAREADVPHYRAVDYGKGPAYFLAAVEERLNSGERFLDVCVDTRTDLGRDLVGLLRRYAALVVQGF